MFSQLNKIYYNSKTQLQDIRWKPIFIPPEHGIWGFTIESFLLGFFLSEGMSKYFISIWMILLPFAKQTSKIFLQDFFSKRKFLRKYIAFIITMFFFLIFGILFYFIYKTSLYESWILLLLALLSGFLVNIFEIKGFYQNIFVEIIGSFIPVLFALSMILSLEVQWEIIQLFTLILGFRNISSVILIRELVDFIKYSKIENFFVIITGFAITILILYFFKVMNLFILIIFFVYLVIFIVLYYLIKIQAIKKAQHLGWIQIILGLIYISIFIYLYYYNFLLNI